MFRKATWCALLGLFAFAGGAHALTIQNLDTGGLVNGPWVIENDATVAGDASNWRIHVGTDNAPSVDGDFQPAEWHAVGKELPENELGYLVDFTYDLWTWDSYVPDGYYDNFGVNLNLQDFLWNLDLADPPETDPWPGSTWWAGGSAEDVLEHFTGADSVSLAGTGTDPVYLTVFLSTGLDPNQDTEVPSWGAFNDTAPGIPEPATLLMLASAMVGLGAVARRRLRS